MKITKAELQQNKQNLFYLIFEFIDAEKLKRRILKKLLQNEFSATSKGIFYEKGTHRIVHSLYSGV